MVFEKVLQIFIGTVSENDVVLFDIFTNGDNIRHAIGQSNENNISDGIYVT